MILACLEVVFQKTRAFSESTHQFGLYQNHLVYEILRGVSNPSLTHTQMTLRSVESRCHYPILTNKEKACGIQNT